MDKTEETRLQIATTIKDLVKEWGEHPFDINNGMCEDFASELSALLTAEKVRHYFRHTDLITDLPGHVWIEWDGFHFDAEEPYGVSDHLYLPIFMRHQNDSRRKD